MTKRFLLSLGLAAGLVWLVLALLAGRPTQALGTCHRQVVNPGGVDAGNCSSSACRTVQYALRQAFSGDTICVADRSEGGYPGPSVYTGTIVITKSVVLDGAWQATCINPGVCAFTSIACTPQNIVLDGEGKGRVISITGSISPAVRCFTITGGDANGLRGDPDGYDAGGGIYSRDAAPLIVGNVITGNYGCQMCTLTYGRGGGVYLLNAPATAIISGNLIANNVAADLILGAGGGVALRDSSAQVVSNTIQLNRGGIAGDGGGTFVLGGSPAIADNKFLTNTAGTGVMCNGGGLYISSALPLTIERNLFQSNRALNGTGSAGLVSRGGGIYYTGAPGARALIHDNTFLANTAASDSVGEGGGMYLHGLAAGSAVSENSLTGNIAGFNHDGNGGGIYVNNGNVTVVDNRLLSNYATWSGDAGQGGGLYVNGGSALIQGGVISYNAAAAFPGPPAHAAGYGGGIAISGSQAIVQNVWIVGNQGTNSDNTAAGGGIYGYSSTVQIVGNHILSNTTGPGSSGLGGGLYLESSRGAVDGNTILSNSATGNVYSRGGGVRINSCPAFTLTNNIIARNGVSSAGSGVAVVLSTGRLDHNTIAENKVGDGVGVHVESGSSIALYNNIIASHTVGISNTGGAANAGYTLFDGNAQNYRGSLTSANEAPGPAALTADYHLRSGSGAIDRALPLAWVAGDIDGDPRPIGPAPDVGADEKTNACDRYVLNTDGNDAANDCHDPAHPCRTVQYAIHQAQGGDGICVADNPLQPGPSIYTGTLVVDKSVKLDGAWEAACIDPHDLTCSFTPVACSGAGVVLDAQGAGRVVTIMGSGGWISPTIRCLTLTGGSSGTGAGLYASNAALNLFGNVFTDNVATSLGGGIDVQDSISVISANTFISNSAVNGGGGILLTEGSATIHGNRIAENQAGYGGGIHTSGTWVTATANLILNNRGSAWSTSANPGDRFVAVNNVLSGNGGTALQIYNYQADLIHNTIVSNTGSAVSGSFTATITLTNNIIANNKVGVVTSTGSVVSASYNLFWRNNSNSITGTHAVLAEPSFLADGYHLGAGSAAVNRGIATWVTTDIDSDPRSGLPDIGADEYLARVYLPIILRAYP